MRRALNLWQGSTESIATVRSELQHSWAWFLAFGIILAMIGAFAIVESFIATEAVVMVLGISLIAAAIIHMMQALVSRHASLVFSQIAFAILYAIIGVLVLRQPISFAAGFTFVIAIFFMVDGLFKVFASFNRRLPHRGFNALGGLISLALGASIYAQWPVSGLWVIGLFVGITLLFTGVQFAALAFALKPLVSGTAVRQTHPGKPLAQH